MTGSPGHEHAGHEHAGHEHAGHERVGDVIRIGNEFAEVHVRRVDTRNGSRLVITSPRSGRSISLCPLEVEALTRQNTATFSAMIANPFGPLVSDEAADEGDEP